MKYAEKKISLVGWGTEQVLLHTINGHPGISVVQQNRLKLFGLTPWLKGLIAAMPTKARYCHGTPPAPEHVDMVLQMRRNAVDDAVEAIYTQNIYLLAEAVVTTYMAQQYMGAELLPNKGEIGKRFSGSWGVYVFPEPISNYKDLKTNTVLVA
jgi:hypothetical protein